MIGINWWNKYDDLKYQTFQKFDDAEEKVLVHDIILTLNVVKQ